MESSPASQRILTASGFEPFVLILMLPFEVCFLISRMASRMVSHINKGSPSQPCPKLITGNGADSRCGTVYSTISSGVGKNVNRSCVETIGSSSGCSEIHPTQFALHAGETGIGHSHRCRK